MYGFEEFLAGSTVSGSHHVYSSDVVNRYNERASGEGLYAILGRTQHKPQWVQKKPDTVAITVEDIRQLVFQRVQEG